MKISEVKNLPKIAAPGGRVVAEVSPEFLKEKGVGIVTYGIAPNEVIEFPDTEADIKPFTRTVRPNSDAVETLIVVKRNGEFGYFSVAALRRMDYQGKFVGPVCQALPPQSSGKTDPICQFIEIRPVGIGDHRYRVQLDKKRLWWR